MLSLATFAVVHICVAVVVVAAAAAAENRTTESTAVNSKQIVQFQTEVVDWRQRQLLVDHVTSSRINNRTRLQDEQTATFEALRSVDGGLNWEDVPTGLQVGLTAATITGDRSTSRVIPAPPTGPGGRAGSGPPHRPGPGAGCQRTR